MSATGQQDQLLIMRSIPRLMLLLLLIVISNVNCLRSSRPFATNLKSNLLPLRQTRQTNNTDVEGCKNDQELKLLGKKPDDAALRKFCGSHCDGLYSLGCIADYVVCSAKVGYLMMCPLGLVYDTYLEACEPAKKANVCVNNGDNPGTDSVNMTTDSQISCTGISNGFRTPGCSVICFACIFEESVLYTKCPGSLKFDDKKMACLPMERVKACGGGDDGADNRTDMMTSIQITATGATTAAPTNDMTPSDPSTGPTTISNNSTATSRSSTGPPNATDAMTTIPNIVGGEASSASKSTQKMIAFSCETLPDGLYGIQCSTELIGCFNGKAVMMRCPSEFLFDAEEKLCKDQQEMPKCEGRIVSLMSQPTVSNPTQTTLAPSVGGQLPPQTTMAPLVAEQPPSQTTLAPMVAGKLAPYASADDSCKSLGDGMYSSSCSDKSFICINGKSAVLLRCTTLGFDPESSVCVLEAPCSNTSGSAPVLMQPSNPVQGTPELSPLEFGLPPPENTTLMRPMMFSCTGLPDGVYGQICATEFYVCVKGNAALLECPDDFVFDAIAKYCLPRNQLPKCTSSGQQPSFGMPVRPPNNEWEMNVTEVNCEFLPDGMYSNGCSTNFTACVAGSSILMVCPAALKFDEMSVKCLAAADVPNCGGIELEPVIVDEEGTALGGRNRPPLVSTPTPQQPASCVQKLDGLYSDGCSAKFYGCVAGTVIPMRCPGLQKYNQAAKQCMAASMVPDCGSESATNTSEQQQSLEPVGSAKTQPVNLQPSGFTCQEMPDGIYAESCSSLVIICLSNRAIQYSCPEPMKYDALGMACLPANQVSSCNSTESDLAGVESPFSVQMPVPLNTQNFNCSGTSDGVYAIGCTAQYVICTSGMAAFYQCTSPLKFDIDTEMCQETNLIRACGGISPASEGNAKRPRIPSINCMNRPTGPVAFGCSSNFAYCMAGKLQRFKCPKDFKFDNVTGKCLEKSLVTACSMRPEPAAVGSKPSRKPSDGPRPDQAIPIVYLVIESITANTSMYRNDQSSSSVDQRSKTPDVASDDTPTCSGKANGVYAEPCSSEFYLCITGRAFFLHCRYPLLFDSTTYKCVEPALASGCDGQSAAPPVQPVGSGAQPAAVNSCSNREEGIYELEMCSSAFIVCIKNQSYTVNCPPEYAYEALTFTCVSKIAKPNCALSVLPTLASLPTLPTLPTIATLMPAILNPSAPRSYVDPSYLVTIQVDQVDPFTTTLSEFSAASAAPAVLVDSAVPVAQEFPVSPAAPIAAGPAANLTLLPTLPTIAPPAPLPTLILPLPASQSAPAPIPLPAAPSVAPDEQPSISTDNLCAGKLDGLYLNGCTPQFHACISGRTIKMRCPGEQKFDINSKSCAPQQYVPACGSSTRMSAQNPSMVQTIQDDVRKVTPLGAVPLLSTTAVSSIPNLFPAAPFVTSCAGMPDGKYSRGCSSEFVTCVLGEAKLNKCPSNILKFDSRSQRCLPPSFVKECGGTNASTSSQAVATSPVDSTTPAITQPTEKEVSCTSKPDGKYAQGCSPEFVECIAQLRNVLRCPGSLIFDEVAQQCRPASYVSACGGQVGQTPSATTEDPSIEAQPEAIERPLFSSISCFGQPDGAYGDGCSSTFHICISGRELFYKCPEDLKFDAMSEKCLLITKVPACGAQVPEGQAFGQQDTSPPAPQSIGAIAPVTSANTSDMSLSQIGESAILQSGASSNVFECKSLPDGMYTRGCSQKFTICISGMPLMYSCPNQTTFDSLSEQCLSPGSTEPCAARSDQLPVAGSGATTPMVPVVYSIVNIVKLPKNFFFCVGRPDGIYLDNCASDFIVCVNRTTVSLHCTNSLKYDQISGLCVDESRLAECGDGLMSAGGQSSEVARPDAADVAGFCTGKLDGLYSTGCSAKFISCLGGQGTSFDCPDGLKFNNANDLCTPENEIAECSRSVTPSSNTIVSVAPKLSASGAAVAVPVRDGPTPYGSVGSSF